MTLIARDIMNTEVVEVPSSMDLRDLARLFLERGITGAPVVDESGALTGVISQTDLVYYSLTRGDELVMDSHFYHNARVEGHHIPQGFQIEDANSATVADVMTPVVHAVAETTAVDSIARTMTRKHIHRVIVCRGRKVSGVISALDVLSAYSEHRSAGSTAPGKTPAQKSSAKRRTNKTSSAARPR